MEDYIQISKINDFIFCPQSLYFHGIYENFSEKVYHASPQTIGKINHEKIEAGQYSSAKKFLQGLPVYSSKYGIMGKIDILDTEKKILIERKTRLKKIYDGHKFQLYAQYLCLKEMGYEINKLKIHSLEDNKNYYLEIPVGEELEKFKNVLANMRSFQMNLITARNMAKCDNCIYSRLCL